MLSKWWTAAFNLHSRSYLSSGTAFLLFEPPAPSIPAGTQWPALEAGLHRRIHRTTWYESHRKGSRKAFSGTPGCLPSQTWRRPYSAALGSFPDWWSDYILCYQEDSSMSDTSPSPRHSHWYNADDHSCDTCLTKLHIFVFTRYLVILFYIQSTIP